MQYFSIRLVKTSQQLRNHVYDSEMLTMCMIVKCLLQLGHTVCSQWKFGGLKVLTAKDMNFYFIMSRVSPHLEFPAFTLSHACIGCISLQ